MLQTLTNVWNMVSVINDVKICRENTAATVMTAMSLVRTNAPAKLRVC